MRVVNSNQFPPDTILGESPHILWGTSAPDGDLSPFAESPVGSLYAYRNDATAAVRWYQKMADNQTDNDWAALGGLQVISETVALADFTDGGGAAGTYVLTEDIPQGAFVVRCYLLDVTGFTGDTSAVITVGDGSDADRYNTGTPSVFTTANAIDLGAVSGTAIHAAAVTAPTITITSGSDWGAVTAGQLTIRILYYI